MSDIPSILPPEARKHYIDLRNIRDSVAMEQYNEKLIELKSRAAARGMVNSGWFMKQTSNLQKDLADSTVHGIIEDALATCNLYDVPLTKELCTSLEDIARASLTGKYGRGPYVQPIMGNDWPAGAMNQLKQEWDREKLKSMPTIAVMIEIARIADEKVRMEMASKKSGAYKPPQRFAVGAEVRVGWGRIHGVVTQMDDHVGALGQYWHTVKTANGEDRRAGSELELITEPLTNARNFPHNPAPTYIQNINQHGVGNSVSQVGDTHTNILQIGDMIGLKQELATIRAALKGQPESLEADEVLGSLASAERAAQRNDEQGVKHAFSTITKGGWEIVKKVAPTVSSQVLLHYLKQHGIA